jgi:hypothetical protein
VLSKMSIRHERERCDRHARRRRPSPAEARSCLMVRRRSRCFYVGACKPGEESHSFTFAAASICRTLRRSASRARPDGRDCASSFRRLAWAVRRSLNDSWLELVGFIRASRRMGASVDNSLGRLSPDRLFAVQHIGQVR